MIPTCVFCYCLFVQFWFLKEASRCSTLRSSTQAIGFLPAIFSWAMVAKRDFYQLPPVSHPLLPVPSSHPLHCAGSSSCETPVGPYLLPLLSKRQIGVYPECKTSRVQQASAVCKGHHGVCHCGPAVQAAWSHLRTANRREEKMIVVLV